MSKQTSFDYVIEILGNKLAIAIEAYLRAMSVYGNRKDARIFKKRKTELEQAIAILRDAKKND